MPAINVARTDTFEVQRQKINQIGDILSNISAGGSDLQTGNLKLGDGTRTSPSLSFINDSSLGLYRPSEKSIGYVSDGKKILDISSTGFYTYRDLVLQRRQLQDSGLSITSAGSNYESGDYEEIPLTGGSGEGAVANVSVVEYIGSITNSGEGYNSGSYASISLSGGSGSGAVVGLSVTSLEVDITNPGSGYGLLDGDGNRTTTYFNVPLTGGNGSGALVDVFLSNNTGEVETVSINSSGQGYEVGDVLSVDNVNLDNSGSGLELTVTTKPGVITNFDIQDYGTGYQSGDVLSLPPAVNGISTTLDDQSTDITVSSTSGIDAGYIVSQVSGTGSIDPTSVVSAIVNSTTVSLSVAPTTSGSAVLNFSPPTGTGTTQFSYEIGDLGVIDTVTITDGGNGYNDTDVLSLNAYELTQPITKTVVVLSVQELTFNGTLPASTFSVGGSVKLQDGDITNVDVPTSSSTIPGEADNSYNNVPSTTNGSGSGALFTVIRDSNGAILALNVEDGGKGYSIGDNITILGSNVGGVDGPDNIVAPVLNILENTPGEIYAVYSTGGNIDSILIEDLFLTDGDVIVKPGSATPYTINTATAGEFRYQIDGSLTPNLTFYVGDRYTFDLSDSSNTAHTFALSKFPDGPYSPSLIEDINSTLSNSSTQITVADTTNILEGMSVTVSSGIGALNESATTVVSSVDSGTQLTLSQIPANSGDVVLSFAGTEYTDGVVREDSSLTVLITESTPTLYYYCQMHPDMGGKDGLEAIITIDPNNPRTFGSGFTLLVTEVDSTDVITGNTDGEFVSINSTTEQLNSTNIVNSDTITSNILESNTVTTPSINSSTANLAIDVGNTNFTGNVSVNNFFSVDSTNGDITTSGELQTTNGIDVNSKTFIRDNVISTTSGVNLQFQPATGRIVEVLGTTAFAIPSGTTGERPNPAAGEGDGYIRFNSETNQYEGYSNTNQTWSSLGGVRDLDGNTTILAEESVGANDNSLWFINDNVNTVRFTPNHQEFVNVKKLRSVNISAPSYTEWAANIPVSLGQYLKYRNNIYEVTVAGTTGTSGTEPTHTSGALLNGTSELTWHSTAVAPLTFEEISEVRIDPLGFTDLVVNGELRFSNNEISSTNNDIIIKPTGSQKVVIQGTSSLVVPVGDNNSKGNPAQGSIRYSTTDAQFEGYNGAQWGGLGGVKDIDQDTKIEAETGPGNDEDILYFFNAGNNTLRLTTSELAFDSIDTIESGSGNLNLDASLVSFNNLETSIDNSSSTITKISTTKDNLDFGLSSGLYNDHLLRLTDTGSVIYNLGFGTGTPNNLTVLNNTLTNFELKFTKVNTSRLELEKGTTNAGNASVYTPSTESSAKVFVTAHNITTGDKEIVEYFVTNNGTDIFFTDSNNIKTGEELFSSVFDFDPLNNVRISITLGSGLTAGDQVELTIIKTVTKR